MAEFPIPPRNETMLRMSDLFFSQIKTTNNAQLWTQYNITTETAQQKAAYALVHNLLGYREKLQKLERLGVADPYTLGVQHYTVEQQTYKTRQKVNDEGVLLNEVTHRTILDWNAQANQYAGPIQIDKYIWSDDPKNDIMLQVFLLPFLKKTQYQLSKEITKVGVPQQNGNMVQNATDIRELWKVTGEIELTPDVIKVQNQDSQIHWLFRIMPKAMNNCIKSWINKYEMRDLDSWRKGDQVLEFGEYAQPRWQGNYWQINIERDMYNLTLSNEAWHARHNQGFTYLEEFKKIICNYEPESLAEKLDEYLADNQTHNDDSYRRKALDTAIDNPDSYEKLVTDSLTNSKNLQNILKNTNISFSTSPLQWVIPFTFADGIFPNAYAQKYIHLFKTAIIDNFVLQFGIQKNDKVDGVINWAYVNDLTQVPYYSGGLIYTGENLLSSYNDLGVKQTTYQPTFLPGLLNLDAIKRQDIILDNWLSTQKFAGKFRLQHNMTINQSMMPFTPKYLEEEYAQIDRVAEAVYLEEPKTSGQGFFVFMLSLKNLLQNDGEYIVSKALTQKYDAGQISLIADIKTKISNPQLYFGDFVSNNVIDNTAPIEHRGNGFEINQLNGAQDDVVNLLVQPGSTLQEMIDGYGVKPATISMNNNIKYNIGLGYKIGTYDKVKTDLNKRLHFMYDPVYPVVDPHNANIGINTPIMKWAAMGAATEEEEITAGGKDSSAICNYTNAHAVGEIDTVAQKFIAYPLAVNASKNTIIDRTNLIYSKILWELYSKYQKMSLQSYMIEINQLSQWSALKPMYDTMFDGPFGLQDLNVPQQEQPPIVPLNDQYQKLQTLMQCIRMMLQGQNVFETKTTQTPMYDNYNQVHNAAQKLQIIRDLNFTWPETHNSKEEWEEYIAQQPVYETEEPEPQLYKIFSTSVNQTEICFQNMLDIPKEHKLYMIKLIHAETGWFSDNQLDIWTVADPVAIAQTVVQVATIIFNGIKWLIAQFKRKHKTKPTNEVSIKDIVTDATTRGVTLVPRYDKDGGLKRQWIYAAQDIQIQIDVPQDQAYIQGTNFINNKGFYLDELIEDRLEMCIYDQYSTPDKEFNNGSYNTDWSQFVTNTTYSQFLQDCSTISYLFGTCRTNNMRKLSELPLGQWTIIQSKKYIDPILTAQKVENSKAFEVHVKGRIAARAFVDKMPYDYKSDQDLDPDNTMILIDCNRRAYFRRHIVVKPPYTPDNKFFDKTKTTQVPVSQDNIINISIMPWTKITTMFSE